MRISIIEGRRITGHAEASEATIEANGWVYVEGWHDPQQCEVMDGVVVPRAEAVAANLDAAWATLRAERTRRLADCDWTQVIDAPADKLAWSIYRQALRDLPETTTDPTAPVWPVAP